VEVTPEETLALAQSCRTENKSSGERLHFKQPGGKNTEVPIDISR
jgi:hypothetical protein